MPLDSVNNTLIMIDISCDQRIGTMIMKFISSYNADDYNQEYIKERGRVLNYAYSTCNNCSYGS